MHIDVIKDLLKKNDVIFYGDIKSQDIPQISSNKTLKKDFQMLRFYQFKEGKEVFSVNEAYTTKTCSKCVKLNDPKTSKFYSCSECDRTVGRDKNAAKKHFNERFNNK
ncbi:hypothetical protein HK099_006592 [Clydaea vesicula]|uniref:Cas12f1-like TNB domain-containing protein n=1 Tax=Clydaea vesicula TaxID=447962 RepID=A0AAD5Y304_9FUNG|nr:hypothetical protein HK099_006592 [Clydaea vesicula]